MYKAYYGDKPLYNPQADDLALIEPIVTLEENKAGTFTFTMPLNHPLWDVLKKRAETISVYNDAELIFRGVVINTTTDFYKNRQVYCEGELTYFNDSIQRQARYQGVNVTELLKAYIDNHNAQVEEKKRFKLGRVTVQDPNDYIYCFSNMETTMSCIKEDLTDDLDGFLSIRYEKDGSKYLDYLKDGRTNSQAVRLGENLIDFESNLDTSEIATAIIPLGAKLEDSEVNGLEKRLDISSINKGDDFVYSPDAVKAFGWIYKTVTFDEVTTPETLKKKAEHYLTQTQFEKVVINAKIVDLSILGNDEPFKISDNIRIISKPHGLDKYFRMTKRVYHLNAPEKDEISLGKQEINSLSAQQAELAQALKNAAESIAPKDNVLSLAKQNATALINGNGDNGYVVLHENDDGVVYEILIMDTPDIKTARKVWRWNNSGLGYSNNGYNGQYGLAMTIDGSIVADFITAGIMSGNRIRGGQILVGGSSVGMDGSIIGYTANNIRTFLLDKTGAYFNGTLEANTLSGGAGKQLKDAIDKANEAIQIAQRAADQAQRTADEGVRIGQKAEQASQTAQSAASTANSAAKTAQSAASTAQSTANAVNSKLDKLITGSLSATTIRVGSLYCGGRKLSRESGGNAVLL